MPHTAADGWSYNIKDDREWHEIQIIARTPAGNLNEGRKSFFAYDPYDRASKKEARAEAERYLAVLLGGKPYGATRTNPPKPKRAVNDRSRHIDNNHYRLSDREASEACGGKLPRHGYEKEVSTPHGKFWISRTPLSHANKRGWVWCAYPVGGG